MNNDTVTKVILGVVSLSLMVNITLVGVIWRTNEERLDRMEARLERIDHRMESIQRDYWRIYSELVQIQELDE